MSKYNMMSESNTVSDQETCTRNGSYIRCPMERTHKCFRCEQRFLTSGSLLLHMRETHGTFDTHFGSECSHNSDAEKSDRYNNAIATCPFCQQDCQTRKKLMRHLELEHKDDEAEEEPEVKVICLDNANKHKFLEQLKTAKAENGQVTESSDPALHTLLKALGNDSTKRIVSTGGPDKASAIKLQKFQYKCFWCDASFQKRGKLMDHIDTVHKANKQQSEAEAELIQGSGALVEEVKMPSTSVELLAVSGGRNLASQSKPILAAAYISSSTRTEESKRSTNTIQKQSCVFKAAGLLTESSIKVKSEVSQENRFKFYIGRELNPMTELQRRNASVIYDSRCLASSQDMLFGSYLMHPSIHSMMPPYPLHDHRHAGIHPLIFNPQIPRIPNHMFQTPRLPYMTTSHDFLLSQQAVSVGKRSPSQTYMVGIQSHDIGIKHSSDGALDLTKMK